MITVSHEPAPDNDQAIHHPRPRADDLGPAAHRKQAELALISKTSRTLTVTEQDSARAQRAMIRVPQGTVTEQDSARAQRAMIRVPQGTVTEQDSARAQRAMIRVPQGTVTEQDSARAQRAMIRVPQGTVTEQDSARAQRAMIRVPQGTVTGRVFLLRRFVLQVVATGIEGPDAAGTARSFLVTCVSGQASP